MNLFRYPRSYLHGDFLFFFFILTDVSGLDIPGSIVYHKQSETLQVRCQVKLVLHSENISRMIRFKFISQVIPIDNNNFDIQTISTFVVHQKNRESELDQRQKITKYSDFGKHKDKV